MIESGVTQSQTIACQHVSRLEFQRLLKRSYRLLKSILVVLCASQVIPILRNTRLPLKRKGEPLISAGEIAKQNVIQRNDFQIIRRWPSVFGPLRKLGKRSSNLVFARLRTYRSRRNISGR